MIHHDKAFQKSSIGDLLIGQDPKAVLFVRLPQGEPLIELVLRDFISFTELFNGKTACKVLSQKAQNEEQAVAGIRNNDIGKNGMGMLTAVTENPHHTKVGLLTFTGLEVNDGAAIVVMDVTVTGASTDGTGFQVGLKPGHVGIKKRF